MKIVQFPAKVFFVSDQNNMKQIKKIKNRIQIKLYKNDV